MKTTIEEATRPSSRSFSAARAACEAMASDSSCASEMGRPKERETSTLFRGPASSTISWQEMPRNSRARRSPTTPAIRRIKPGSASARSMAERMPCERRRDARPGPTPQTSSASTPRRKAVRPSTEAGTTITPPLALSVFARSFASLQRTFVGAIPSEIGMPVRLRTSARIRSPRAFASASGMSGKPRNASSTE